MEKMVLLYHFEGIRLAQAHKALEKLPFRIREVKKEEYGYPLGYLAGLPGILPLGKVYEGPQLEQEMVVFADSSETISIRHWTPSVRTDWLG